MSDFIANECIGLGVVIFIGGLIGGSFLEYRYSSPRLLQNATPKQQWHWSFICAFIWSISVLSMTLPLVSLYIVRSDRFVGGSIILAFIIFLTFLIGVFAMFMLGMRYHLWDTKRQYKYWEQWKQVPTNHKLLESSAFPDRIKRHFIFSEEAKRLFKIHKEKGRYNQN